MSFTSNSKGTTYAPGWFLANNEDCTRETRTFKQDGDTGAVTVTTNPDGTKYVKMGSLYKASGGESTIGVVYEDVDVTNGDAPGSVVTAGTVYKERLASGADTELKSLAGFKVIDEPKITRPEAFNPAAE